MVFGDTLYVQLLSPSMQWLSYRIIGLQSPTVVLLRTIPHLHVGRAIFGVSGEKKMPVSCLHVAANKLD